MARGFLTGKYKRGEDIPGDSRFAGEINRDDTFGKRTKQHFSDMAYDVLGVLEELAQEKSKSMSQVALAWVAAQPGVTSPIIGPRTMEHLEDNLGAVGITFSEDDLQRLDDVAAPESAIVNYYTGQMMDFKPPQHRW